MKINKTVKMVVPKTAAAKPAKPTKTAKVKSFNARNSRFVFEAQLFAARGGDIIEGTGIKAGTILQMKWGNQPALKDCPNMGGQVVSFKPNGVTSCQGQNYRVMRTGGDYCTVFVPKTDTKFRKDRVPFQNGFLSWVREHKKEKVVSRGVKVS